MHDLRFVAGGDLFSEVVVALIITREPGIGNPISDLGHWFADGHGSA